MLRALCRCSAPRAVRLPSAPRRRAECRVWATGGAVDSEEGSTLTLERTNVSDCFVSTSGSGSAAGGSTDTKSNNNKHDAYNSHQLEVFSNFKGRIFSLVTKSVQRSKSLHDPFHLRLIKPLKHHSIRQLIHIKPLHRRLILPQNSDSFQLRLAK